MRTYRTNKRTVLRWFKQGVFTVDLNTGIVRKGSKNLKQRTNKRQRSERGDPRVDLCHNNTKCSIHISHIVWMVYHNRILPKDFEIHHLDEDPLNNVPENLVAVFKHDHHKLHQSDNSHGRGSSILTTENR